VELLREISANAGLDAVLVLLCSFLPRAEAVGRNPLFGLGAGLLFGATALLSMQFPVTLLPGVVIDSRTVLTALSGAYFGPWAAVSCLAAAGAYRAFLGGVGTLSGLSILVFAAALGTVYRWLTRRQRPSWTPASLALLGLVLGLGSVVLTLLLPEAIRWQVFGRTLVPVPAAYLLSVLVCGGLLHVVQTRKQIAFELKANLEEKVVLLRELHHRTKNNMTVIVSFLRMAGEGVTDERLSAVLNQAESRIQSMALVHQKLYESKNLSHIDLKDYLTSLLDLVLANAPAGSRVERRVEMDSFKADIDTAMPCGLIVNELVTNALVHGFPSGRPGTIVLELRASGAGAVLTVSDDGVGFPAGFDPEASAGIGLQVVNSLARQQLKARLEHTTSPGGGVSWVLTLPPQTAEADA
jgi:two-component sensor histidine kinase